MNISISASEQAISDAENQLGVSLPDLLKQIWRASNGLEYPQDWRIYPVFDRESPKKSWGHIVEENRRQTYDYMQEALLRIAGDSYGNHLVLKIQQNQARPAIYAWNHETTQLKKSAITLEKILRKAESRRERILNQIDRNMKKRKRRSNKPTGGDVQ